MDTEVTAVSGDGSTVIGRSNGQAFRWQNGTMEALGAWQANDVSADGSVIVGTMNEQAVRWEGGVLVPLPDVGTSAANGVSANAAVIVGTGYFGNPQPEAAMWQAGTVESLGVLPGYDSSSALGVSANALVAVGVCSGGAQPEAFRWEAGNMLGLGWLGTGTNSWAYDASADGSVVVGESDTVGHNFRNAFRWEGGIMSSLGTLPGDTSSHANAVSADGSVIVGKSSPVAFIWHADKGMAWMRDVLVDLYCLEAELDGWTLIDATDVSADGLTVVGFDDIGSMSRGWIVRLDQQVQDCIAGDFTGDGLVTVEDVGPFVSTLLAPCNATPPERCAANIHEDWKVDGMDIAAFLALVFP